MSRIRFEKFKARAEEHVLKARQGQVSARVCVCSCVCVFVPVCVSVCIHVNI